MKSVRWIFGLLCFLFYFTGDLCAQLITHSLDDEVALYAATKQVNQFFRRFNNEESIDGTRYYEKDSLYRNPATRAVFLNLLFDKENRQISEGIKLQFIQEVGHPDKPVYLDFHGGNWLAEVSAIFYWEGKEVTTTLFLKLQEEKVGSKWVIDRICFKPFQEYFRKDTLDTVHFLHPLSHELEFMNLYDVFRDEKKVLQDYTERNFTPDFLALFLYEVKRGNLRFKTVKDVEFHFFQIDHWYFKLSQFNRKGYNTGWLISDLIKVNAKEKDELLKRIYNRYE